MVAQITHGRESLGLQNVTVHGVSPRTHFAQVLVEADYRMKLTYRLESPRRMVAFVDQVRPTQVSAMPCSAGSSCPTISACV